MFSDKLRKLRKAKYLTQGELAKKLNMTASTIGMYEQGRRKPKLADLAAIAAFFGVSTDYLLAEDADATTDVYTLITELENKLISADGLMFNGVPLTADDIRKLTDAVELSARIVLDRKKEDNGR